MKQIKLLTVALVALCCSNSIMTNIKALVPFNITVPTESAIETIMFSPVYTDGSSDKFSMNSSSWAQPNGSTLNYTNNLTTINNALNQKEELFLAFQIYLQHPGLPYTLQYEISKNHITIGSNAYPFKKSRGKTLKKINVTVTFGNGIPNKNFTLTKNKGALLLKKQVILFNFIAPSLETELDKYLKLDDQKSLSKFITNNQNIDFQHPYSGSHQERTTLLIEATYNGALNCVKALLNGSSDLPNLTKIANNTNSFGHTAAYYAMSFAQPASHSPTGVQPKIYAEILAILTPAILPSQLAMLNKIFSADNATELLNFAKTNPTFNWTKLYSNLPWPVEQQTPLSAAVYAGAIHCVKAIFDPKNKALFPNIYNSLSTPSSNGYTPLHYATYPPKIAPRKNYASITIILKAVSGHSNALAQPKVKPKNKWFPLVLPDSIKGF